MLRPLRLLLLALAALPGAAAAQAYPVACQYLQVATLPVRYTGPSLHLTIEGRIDGTPADMLVDTGAAFSMLTRTATERRGLSLQRSGERLVGVGGYSRMYTARVKEFTAGPATLSNARVRVLGDFGTTPSFDAILGAQFLLQHDLEMSLATKEIRFFKPTNCKQAMLAYWDANAIELPFLSSFSRQSNPVFRATINGKEVTASIDSGSGSTVMTRDVAERVGLKMDSAGVERVGFSVGAGTERVARWRTTLTTLQIGRETINNADVGVVDADLSVDLLLGADFLRAHRVLFAMSQKKLYISYLGGDPLGQRRRIEPWMQQEADAGNGDAQMALAWMYTSGQGVARDPVQARAWIDKAADAGHPRANLMVGQRLVAEEKYTEAAGRIRAALERMPGERSGALWLYRAQARITAPESARRDLAAAFTHDTDEWPGPIADYYLGKVDQDKLLKLAREDKDFARMRTCQAWTHIAEQHRIAGDPVSATRVMAQTADCRAPP